MDIFKIKENEYFRNRYKRKNKLEALTDFDYNCCVNDIKESFHGNKFMLSGILAGSFYAQFSKLSRFYRIAPFITITFVGIYFDYLYNYNLCIRCVDPFMRKEKLPQYPSLLAHLPPSLAVDPRIIKNTNILIKRILKRKENRIKKFQKELDDNQYLKSLFEYQEKCLENQKADKNLL